MIELENACINYFKGLESRFNPNFKSISIEDNVIIMCIEESFKNHCINNIFL